MKTEQEQLIDHLHKALKPYPNAVKVACTLEDFKRMTRANDMFKANLKAAVKAFKWDATGTSKEFYGE